MQSLDAESSTVFTDFQIGISYKTSKTTREIISRSLCTEHKLVNLTSNFRGHLPNLDFLKQHI